MAWPRPSGIVPMTSTSGRLCAIRSTNKLASQNNPEILPLAAHAVRVIQITQDHLASYSTLSGSRSIMTSIRSRCTMIAANCSSADAMAAFMDAASFAAGSSRTV